MPCCGHEFVELRERVRCVHQPRVAQKFREVIARFIDLIERDAQSPDVALGGLREHFFAQRLAAAVKTAGRLPKAEIRGVLLGEARPVRLRPAEDAAAGDLPPGDAGRLAGEADSARQNGVAEETFCLVVLARVDIRLAGVARRVDHERRPERAQAGGQPVRIGVVELATRKAAMGNAPAFEEPLVSAPNVARAPEEYDHEWRKLVPRRPASKREFTQINPPPASAGCSGRAPPPCARRARASRSARRRTVPGSELAHARGRCPRRV